MRSSSRWRLPSPHSLRRCWWTASRSRARIQARWHLYLLGMWAIAYLPVRLERRVLNDVWGIGVLLAEGLAVIVILEIAARHRARKWTLPPEPEVDDSDPEALTFLNLGPGAGHNPQPAI